MTTLRPHHLFTIIHLLAAGCGSAYVSVTTLALGKASGISQQAASVHLAELEQDGMVRRIPGGRGRRIRVTKKGYAEVVRISSMLRAAIDKKPIRPVLYGTVESGVGEGAYYMSLPGYVKQFQDQLGMIPYPGTLNIRLDADSTGAVLALGSSEGVMVQGFSDGQRTYGWALCYDALLRTNKDIQPVRCHLIRLERTHHDTSIAELVSPDNLRQAASLTDGAKVTISLD